MSNIPNLLTNMPNLPKKIDKYAQYPYNFQTNMLNLPIISRQICLISLYFSHKYAQSPCNFPTNMPNLPIFFQQICPISL